MSFLRVCLLVLVFAPAAAFAGSDWIVYEHCTLQSDRYFDGDSFQVRTSSPTTGKSYTYVFRLYGADCAETDTRFPDRLAAQAKDFGRPVNEMVGWGEKAKEFTAGVLSRPFTVITCKQDARGASVQHRYFAIVIDADGRDLAETLVRSGLARGYGAIPATPAPKIGDGARYRNTLASAENQARAAHAGVWSKGVSAQPGEPGRFKTKAPFE